MGVGSVRHGASAGFSNRGVTMSPARVNAEHIVSKSASSRHDGKRQDGRYVGAAPFIHCRKFFLAAALDLTEASSAFRRVS
jgi:hypothetical protein